MGQDQPWQSMILKESIHLERSMGLHHSSQWRQSHPHQLKSVRGGAALHRIELIWSRLTLATCGPVESAWSIRCSSICVNQSCVSTSVQLEVLEQENKSNHPKSFDAQEKEVEIG